MGLLKWSSDKSLPNRNVCGNISTEEHLIKPGCGKETPALDAHIAD
jgi:hypothetical protein